jgi:serine/threonine protein kinase
MAISFLFLKVTFILFTEYIFRLAKDFFNKLCSYPPSERYDAKSALKHPWITGNSKDEIPLT